MTPATRLAIVGLTSVLLLNGDARPIARAQASSDRLLVVVSDLHFGVGRVNNRWHAMEDFRWFDAFQAFLAQVDEQGGGKSDLVIAGDAFELWQSLGTECRDARSDYGCTEAEVLVRLRHALSAHQDSLRAIGAFARRGDNRVVFIPGNHDAGLLFPSAAAAVVAATQAATPRVRVDAEGYWLSADRQILVEHGHQIGAEVNRLRLWPRPFVGAAPPHLERPWGEQFVQEFYNQYEVRYPIIDNVTEEGAGVRYAKELEGWTGLTAATGRFLAFYASKLSAAQMATSLGTATGNVRWNLSATRERGLGSALEALPAGDPVRQAFIANPGLLAPANLPDEELIAICDGLAAASGVGRGCVAQDGSLGALAQAALGRSKARIVGDYLVARQAELTSPGNNGPRVAVFVYAHTHVAEAGLEPLAARYPDWNPRVVNAGAWQRTVTPDQLESLRCRVAAGSSPITLQAEDLPACYSSTWVRPYTGTPRAQLRYWVGDGTTGRMADQCQWVSPCP